MEYKDILARGSLTDISRDLKRRSRGGVVVAIFPPSWTRSPKRNAAHASPRSRREMSSILQWPKKQIEIADTRRENGVGGCILEGGDTLNSPLRIYEVID